MLQFSKSQKASEREYYELVKTAHIREFVFLTENNLLVEYGCFKGQISKCVIEFKMLIASLTMILFFMTY